MSGCDSQCCVTPSGWQSCPELLHFCKRHAASYLQASLCGVRKEHCPGSQEPDSSPGSPPSASLPAPAFSSVKWAWDKMVPELLSRTDNGILYEFQGGEWLQMHPLHADGALSLVSVTSPALFLQCCLPRPPPWSQRKGDRKNTKQAVSQLCTSRLAEKTCPWDAVGPLESAKCCGLSWVSGPPRSRCAHGSGSAKDALEIAPVVERVHRSQVWHL